MTAQNSTNNLKKSNKAEASANNKAGFIKGLVSEFKKITWASKKKVKKATATVLTFCVVYMTIVGVFDLGFKNLFRFVFK